MFARPFLSPFVFLDLLNSCFHENLSSVSLTLDDLLVH